MFTMTSGNVKLPYKRLGSGEPLLLIHGLGGMKEGWSRQQILADQYDLIIPDLRGHGQNDTLHGISIENFAKDIIALLDELEIESAHICGFSMGGTVAQEIYRQASERCRSLILVSTFHFAPKRFGEWFVAYRKSCAKDLTPEEQQNLAARRSLYSWSEENIKKFTECYNPHPVGYYKSMEACLNVDNRALLSVISVPTLVIGCQYDTVLPVWVQISMHKNIPNCELVIFKNCGHVAKLEAADQFNHILRGFLNKYKQAG